MKKGIIILLSVVFILIILPYGYLAFSGSGYDRSDILLGDSVMSSAERYSFNPQDETVDIRLVKDDIYAVVKNTEGSDAVTVANEELSDYGLVLKRLGISFSEDGVTADAKLIFRNFLPIPVHAEAAIERSGSEITLTLTKLSVGGLIKISPDIVNSFIDSEDLTFDLAELHPLFKTVEGFASDENGLLITIPYPVEWLMAGIDFFPSDFTMITDFVDLDELDTIMPAVYSYTEGDSSGIISLLDSFSDNPEGFVKLKAELIGLGQSYAASIFFNLDGSEYNPVLLPEITKEYVSESYDSLMAGYQSLYDERTCVLSDAFQFVLEGYADGSIVSGGRSMVFKDGKSAVDFDSIPALEGAEAWLDRESFRVILATNCGDYSLHQVPSGNKITALIFLTRTGRPVVAYRFTSNQFKIKSLGEANYQKLMKSSSVPTYDLGEHTTKR